MKIGFVADCHLGNHRRFGGPVESSLNRRCREGLAVFSRAVARASELKCDEFIVLGDLFDYQRPEPSLIAAVQRVMQTSSCHVTVLVGNHDQTSSSLHDNALAPLFPIVKVVETPWRSSVSWVDLALVPFHPGGSAALTWLPDVLAELYKTDQAQGVPRVLGLHLGIADKNTAPWLRGAADSIEVGPLMELAQQYGIQAVFAGNWHDRRYWAGGPGSPTVFQLGALIPTGWDNPGLDGYGTLAIWEDGEVEYEELTGPRFVKMKPDDGGFDRESGHQVYVSATASPDDVSGFQSWLESKRMDGSIVDGEVTIDATEATIAARSAATAAKSADTLAEALAGFVGEMVLEEGIDREEVVALARGYLGGAA